MQKTSRSAVLREIQREVMRITKQKVTKIPVEIIQMAGKIINDPQMELTSHETDYNLLPIISNPYDLMFQLRGISIGFKYGQMPLKQMIRSPSA